MISDDVTRIELESRKRALEEYKLRCQELHVQNDALKAERDEREKDAMQIISFLRKDAERKDELIDSLKGTIGQQRDAFAQQREQEAETTNQRFAALEEQFRGQTEAQQRQITRLQRELSELQEFKDRKEELEDAMQRGEQVSRARRLILGRRQVP
eukprot:1730040-Pleurochrysis_carterae.AAC.4